VKKGRKDMNKVRELNDEFRHSLLGGRHALTEGVLALPAEDRARILELVRTFSAFHQDNDPYGEHDFGKVVYKKHSVFWKIDYYDKNLEFHSSDPADEALTERVMTVMLAQEY
jgi:Protein of unknown function (DUF3768)